MSTELLRGVAPPSTCTYLPEETSSLAYRYYSEIPVENYEALLERGWRRQGMCFFRPACPTCTKCRSLRVDVENFRPTKSQRRCLKRNANIRLVVRNSSLTNEHIQLFNAYHADMNRRRGWNDDETSPSEYAETFLAGRFPFAAEFLYFKEKQLVGVGLVDVTPNSLSSVYFYHDPTWRPDSPGTFSALKEIEFAQQTGRRWLYLGYWIPENQSMSYKNRFTPHQLLTQYPDDPHTPNWFLPTNTPTSRHQDEPMN